jgi:hypothetical protein
MINRTVVLAVFIPVLCAGQDQHDATDAGRAKGVDARGDHVMGFSHENTVHHFRLYGDGGAIEAEAKEANDTRSRDEIREHFAHIAHMFAAGNFRAAMLIHDEVPPGVMTMKRLKNDIIYTFEKSDRGGRVRIVTTNPEALKAIHDFLRYQIKDHRTGDAVEIPAATRPAAIQKPLSKGR